MNKKYRQYLGVVSAILAYYIIHEGAHLLYALSIGTFKQINIMGMGVQIDVYAERMTENEMGIFCVLGSIATAVTAYFLIGFIPWITRSSSKVFKACMYYITIALLVLDPIYLSVICGFVGGGDMNGISLLIPEGIARLAYGILLVMHGVIIGKVVIPKYTLAFIDDKDRDRRTL